MRYRAAGRPRDSGTEQPDVLLERQSEGPSRLCFAGSSRDRPDFLPAGGSRRGPQAGDHTGTDLRMRGLAMSDTTESNDERPCLHCLIGDVIDVSAHGVDRRQRAEPRKYVRAANIPAWMMGSQPASAASACGRSRPWVSEIAPMVRIMTFNEADSGKTQLHGRVRFVPVLGRLRLFGAASRCSGLKIISMKP